MFTTIQAQIPFLSILSVQHNTQKIHYSFVVRMSVTRMHVSLTGLLSLLNGGGEVTCHRPPTTIIMINTYKDIPDPIMGKQNANYRPARNVIKSLQQWPMLLKAKSAEATRRPCFPPTPELRKCPPHPTKVFITPTQWSEFVGGCWLIVKQ